MPNANTITRLIGAPSPAQGKMAIPPSVPASGSAYIVTDQTGSAALLQIGDSNAQPTGAQTYGSGFDGFPFKIRVAWKVTTKAACNVTVAVAVAAATATTYTVGNIVMTTGAVSNGTGNFNGFLEGQFLWDSTGQKMGGAYWGNLGATSPAIVDLTTCTNAVSVTTQAGLNFVIALTLSDQTAGTTVTITEFCAEAV